MSDAADAIERLDQRLADALAGIRAREAAGQLSPAEAAAGRVRALEDHLAAVRRLNRDCDGSRQ